MAVNQVAPRISIFVLNWFNQFRTFSCRALSEDEPEAKYEVSANGTRTLNENERSEVRI